MLLSQAVARSLQKYEWGHQTVSHVIEYSFTEKIKSTISLRKAMCNEG